MRNPAIRITCEDGTNETFRVTDIETGQDLTRTVRAICITASVDRPVEVDVRFIAPEFSLCPDVVRRWDEIIGDEITMLRRKVEELEALLAKDVNSNAP